MDLRSPKSTLVLRFYGTTSHPLPVRMEPQQRPPRFGINFRETPLLRKHRNERPTPPHRRHKLLPARDQRRNRRLTQPLFRGPASDLPKTLVQMDLRDSTRWLQALPINPYQPTIQTTPA